MSQNTSEEMPKEIDFSRGVRGQYFARYKSWAGITTATGALNVNALSTGEASAPKLVVVSHHAIHTSPPRSAVAGPRIAPEVRTGSASLEASTAGA